VVLSFNDDECTDLCTLLAEDIVRANHDLGPAAGHVVWLAVNANPFYPGVAAVQAWTDAHELGDQPNWYFGTAQPSVLASIWHTYGIDVQLDYQTRTVVHGTEMFFIDPSGRERAIAEFGTASADTDLFGHGIAQMADDLLPAREQASHVGGPSAAAPSQTNAAIGATAPGFSLPYLSGGHGTFRLADLRGRYAVLSFWSSTCTACRSDLSNIEAAYRKVAPHVSFVGIDVADQRGPARTLAALTGLTYPLVSDQSGSASASEKITGLPYTVVLDKSGQVLIRHPGLVTTEQLVYLLESDVPVLSQMGS
jgi:peroxiredoxin